MVTTPEKLSRMHFKYNFLDFSGYPLICKFHNIKLKCYTRKLRAEKLLHVQDISEICQAPFGLSQYIRRM
jgi:hypothetical protein